MRRLGPLYGGAVALVHSTPWRWPDTIGGEARNPGWIVALGLPIGLVAWLVASAGHALGLPPTIDALLGLTMLSLASAGIVERGLADRIDSLSGGAAAMSARAVRTPGSVAIVSLVLVTLLRAFSVVAVAPSHWLGLFVATAVAGRWAAVFLQAIGDPIIDDDAPRSLVATPAPAWLVIALSIGAAAIGIVAFGKVGLLALVVAAALAFAIGLDAHRRDRGLSGPVVATAAAIGELVMLLAATTVG